MSLSLVADIASWILIAAGSFFIVVGGIGMIRLPEVFTRIHAASLIDGAGAGLILAGLAIQAGATLIALKLLFLFLLLLFTSPVATHAVAQAALTAGLKPKLSEDRRPGQEAEDA